MDYVDYISSLFCQHRVRILSQSFEKKAWLVDLYFVMASDNTVVLSAGPRYLTFPESSVSEDSPNQSPKRHRELSPRHWSYRYVILFLLCTVNFIQSYIYNVPLDLGKPIVKILNIDYVSYNLLYSVCLWSNIILSPLGGVLVDRFVGPCRGTLVFVVVSLVGQFGFSLGAYFNSFLVMITFRFLIGVGSQMTLATTSALTACWFKNKEIGFAFAWIGVSCHLGRVCGQYLEGILFDWLNFVKNGNVQLGTALFIPFCILLVCTVLTFLLAFLDKRGERSLARNKNEMGRIGCKCLKEFGVQFWLTIAMFISFYPTAVPFLETSNSFFTQKFNLSVKQASTVTVVACIVPLFAPVIGILVDFTGSYFSWGLFGGFGIVFGARVLLVFSNNNFIIPFVGNVVVSIAYICFDTAMRAVPAFLVNKNHLVTAYSTLEVFHSIGVSIVDIVIGILTDSHGYLAQEIFLLYFLLIGMLSGVLLEFFFLANHCE